MSIDQPLSVPWFIKMLSEDYYCIKIPLEKAKQKNASHLKEDFPRDIFLQLSLEPDISKINKYSATWNVT